ncbi:MAG: flagellar biosynthesis anti-sigma factor FlgM [Desulfobacterales bacterium]|jgi:negative regulator of flagellin synthesis FlgM|nr:flagellar biosynthesis anti-sigma factor FlgM [Desulfobacterales bacterium]
MKIYPGSEIKPPINVQKKSPVNPSQKATKINDGDKVDFSTQLQQVQDMENCFSTNSDRQARLREVKEQIANGTYAPNPQKVAASLLKYIVEGNSDG